MDVLDVVLVASMGVLAVFFASVAVLEWWDARAERSDERADAEVIQHPRSDNSRISSAA